MMWFKKSEIERLLNIYKKVKEIESDMKMLLETGQFFDKQIMEIRLATYRSQMLTIGFILEKIFSAMYPSEE